MCKKLEIRYTKLTIHSDLYESCRYFCYVDGIFVALNKVIMDHVGGYQISASRIIRKHYCVNKKTNICSFTINKVHICVSWT